MGVFGYPSLKSEANKLFPRNSHLTKGSFQGLTSPGQGSLWGFYLETLNGRVPPSGFLFLICQPVKCCVAWPTHSGGKPMARVPQLAITAKALKGVPSLVWAAGCLPVAESRD